MDAHALIKMIPVCVYVRTVRREYFVVVGNRNQFHGPGRVLVEKDEGEDSSNMITTSTTTTTTTTTTNTTAIIPLSVWPMIIMAKARRRCNRRQKNTTAMLAPLVENNGDENDNRNRIILVRIVCMRSYYIKRNIISATRYGI